MSGLNETDVVSTQILTIATILHGGRKRPSLVKKKFFLPLGRVRQRKYFPGRDTYVCEHDSFTLNYWPSLEQLEV